MKSAKQAATPEFWHPNFRIEETLPDTKVIRTSFVVNFAAAALALLLGAWFVQRELAAAGLRTQVAEWENTIATNQPRLTKAAQQQKDFAAAEKKVREIETFVAPRLVASDFLKTIADTLPKLITLDLIEVGTDTVHLRGSVVGATERSAPLAKAYAEQLGANPVLAAQMQSVRLVTQNRDQVANRFTFEIEMKLKAAASGR